tara:strand:- start:56 stop:1840 length:1785 start_codon:yes stop_codon:yes gene_type:complete
MASTYSTGKAIELIGTGDQAGTWGSATNQNLEKIDQSMTQYAKILLGDAAGEVPAGSTWTHGTDTFVWGLTDTTQALADGSEGRAPFVEFSNGSSNAPNADVTVKIRSVGVSSYPPRMFYVRNSTDQIMEFFIDSGDTDAKSAQVLVGETALLIISLNASSAANHVVKFVNDSVFMQNLYMIKRTKGDLSGADPQFVLNANSHSNYFGTGTVAIGNDAGNPLIGETDQDQDVFIGASAGGAATAASNDVAVGFEALKDLTTGDENVAIGANAGENLSTGNYNTYVGYKSGMDNNGTGSTFVGHSSGEESTGVGNTAVGYQAYEGTNGSTDGSFNVCVGYQTGAGLTTEDRNVLLGQSVAVTSSYRTGADRILIIDDGSVATAAQPYTHFIYGDMANNTLNFNQITTGASHVKIQNFNTTASDKYFLQCFNDSDNSGGNEVFRIDLAGTVKNAAGLYTTLADYADMFEWADGNPDGEDRIGFSVVLDEGFCRKATGSDPAEDIIGIVSGTACMVGNAAWNEWEGRNAKDEFGRTKDGETNPAYDESMEYVPRQERSEWATVGLVGRIHIRKECPKNPGWRKIRTVSETTEEWLVR